MTLLVIILSLLLHRYVQWCSYRFSFSPVVDRYQRFMYSTLSALNSMPAWLALGVLLLPVLFFILSLACLIHYFFSWPGYFIFSWLLFWYFGDCRDWLNHPLSDMRIRHLLRHSMSYLFSVFFWYALLGPVAMLMYAVVCELRYLPVVAEKSASLSSVLERAVDVLQWLPVRLLGLAFALVGNFAEVFPVWLSSVFASPASNAAYLDKLAQAALSMPLDLEVVEDDDTESIEGLVSLLDRSLVVWLAVLLVLVVASWF